MKFLGYCLRCGYSDRYGQGRPRALMLAPTNAILRDTCIYTLERLVPPDLILRKRQAPYSMTLVNGCEILGKSAEAEVEGIDLVCLWAEEIQHEAYWADPRRWPNFLFRVRDPRAPFRRIIISGLPTSGHVRETFDREGVHIVRMATADNPAITREQLEGLRAMCPSGLEGVYLNGDWMPPEGAVFRFDSAKHLTDEPPNPQAPTHLALDVGNHSAAIFFQTPAIPLRGVVGDTRRGSSLLVLDEMIELGISVDEMCHRLRIEYPYEIGRNSVICVDPTLRRDETAVIRRHFPKARIIQRSKKDPFYYVEEGIRMVQLALADAHGNVRLRMHRKLMSGRNGVIAALQETKRHHRTGQIIKDDKHDHAADVLRYACCYALQDRGPSAVALR